MYSTTSEIVHGLRGPNKSVWHDQQIPSAGGGFGNLAVLLRSFRSLGRFMTEQWWKELIMGVSQNHSWLPLEFARGVWSRLWSLTCLWHQLWLQRSRSWTQQMESISFIGWTGVNSTCGDCTLGHWCHMRLYWSCSTLTMQHSPSAVPRDSRGAWMGWWSAS